ncbi:MAG: primosomal protein N' [Paludibacteraceae bacterium]|nr:primosomal protein N' [Paludibacteraceae bacterium]
MILIDVILPLPINSLFTYRLPDDLRNDLQRGKRVLVPWGKHKILTGVVWSIHDEEVEEQKLKDVICFLDEQPIVDEHQLALWNWIASYYMCTLGEVMRAALPSALKIESETLIRLADNLEGNNELFGLQAEIVEALSDKKPCNVDELSKVLGKKNIMPAINKLIEAGVLTTEEKVNQPYKEKFKSYVVFNDALPINQVLDSLSKAPQQYNTLLRYFELTQGKITRIERKLLNQGAIKELKNKNILIEQKVAVSRLSELQVREKPHLLTTEQQVAFENIQELFMQKQVVLLRGVTGSGKTDIYIHLINKYLNKGKSILYLVPEIALTTQLTERLAAVFGDRMLVYHSRFSDGERYEIYNNTRKCKQGILLLGVRSSVFMPINNLGLVIVDEEHEPSYKQADPAPRYHARNAAIMLAHEHGANILLGSATPSVETYFNAKTGKYGLVELTCRYGGLELPKINILDTKYLYHRREMVGHVSEVLIDKMRHVIYDEKKQIIVFQNLRGYAPYIECKSCGYIPKCVNCDVSLTYHRLRNILTCHYCGYTIFKPSACPICASNQLSDRGIGTERVEDELAGLFADVKIDRMDADTTRKKNNLQQIIDNFAEGATDILVGTQMISKGLDFDNVGLVAVLNADSLSAQPDYHSSERLFQMLEQVSGRAGRKNSQGEVIIQTSNPRNEILQYIINHDYVGFYNSQIVERKLFRYPPYYRLLYIILSDTDAMKVNSAADEMRLRLQTIFTHRCSNVVEPAVGRVKNRFLRQIVLKFASNEPIAKGKRLIESQIELINADRRFASVRIYTNVDP